MDYIIKIHYYVLWKNSNIDMSDKIKQWIQSFFNKVWQEQNLFEDT
jgi:hypothetical protein